LEAIALSGWVREEERQKMKARRPFFDDVHIYSGKVHFSEREKEEEAGSADALSI
jgi:hypothetical protein